MGKSGAIHVVMQGKILIARKVFHVGKGDSFLESVMYVEKFTCLESYVTCRKGRVIHVEKENSFRKGNSVSVHVAVIKGNRAFLGMPERFEHFRKYLL